MKGIITLFFSIIIIFSLNCCKKDITEAATDSFEWETANINLFEIYTANTSIAIEGSTDGTFKGVITKSCVGDDKDELISKLEDIAFVDSVFNTKVKLAEISNCINCNCFVSAKATIPDSMTYFVETKQGTVNIKKMIGSGKILNDFGKVNVSEHKGSIKIIGAGLISCSYTEAHLGDTLIIESRGGDVSIALPEETSATFDMKTTSGKVEIYGFSSMNPVRWEEGHKQGTFGGNADRLLIRITVDPYSGESNIELGSN